MARSTRLVILIKDIYTLWGRKRFLLPVTYFPTNLVYPFTLRVTGIKIGAVIDTEKGVIKYGGKEEKLIYDNDSSLTNFPNLMKKQFFH